MGSLSFTIPDEDHAIARKIAALENSNLREWFIKAIHNYIELMKKKYESEYGGVLNENR